VLSLELLRREVVELLVMIWSFGPAIFQLILRGAYRGDGDYEEAAAIASPTVPKRFQFRLRTLLLILLFIAIVCTFLRAFGVSGRLRSRRRGPSC
jgi:hypothetical protein